MIELKPAINEVKLTLKSISRSVNLGTVMTPSGGGESVPSEVRQAIYTLLDSAAYATTGLEDEIAIVQAWAQEVTALSISPTSLSLNNDTPQTIVATIVPSGSSVTWSSSDESVATVVGGVVTGVSNGSCVITATAGGKSANCSVTVSGFATLESISAVYTQSGTVYDTDSLDSLKADLVVTGTYSDSSTATIPSTSYSLSGTLAVGTSTITVTYQGKTATFTVTVTMSRATRFGTFISGHGLSKVTVTTFEIPQYGIYVNSTSARGAISTPIENLGYIFTVTDSTKYSIAVYDVSNNTPIATSYENAVDGKYYTGGTKTISWKTADSAKTPYVLIALKKNDGTEFTSAELANGAEAVFNYEIVTPQTVGYEAYPWARVSGTQAPDNIYKNQTTSARARSISPIPNMGYSFSVVDSSKYNMVVYNVTSLDKVDLSVSGVTTPTYPGTDNNKSWGTGGTSTAECVALSFKKLDNTDFTQTELDNMYGTVFTYTQS